MRFDIASVVTLQCHLGGPITHFDARIAFPTNIRGEMMILGSRLRIDLPSLAHPNSSRDQLLVSLQTQVATMAPNFSKLVRSSGNEFQGENRDYSPKIVTNFLKIVLKLPKIVTKPPKIVTNFLKRCLKNFVTRFLNNFRIHGSPLTGALNELSNECKTCKLGLILAILR